MQSRDISQFVLACIVPSAGFAMAPLQKPTRDIEDKDRAGIAQTAERLVAAWNNHDAHGFALTFTEDADFTNLAGRHAQGRANVEAFHAPLFAGIFKESHQIARMRSIRFLRPDLAAAEVDWEMTGAKSLDGAPRPSRRGLLNSLMARQSGGCRLIEVLHNTELTNYPPQPK